MNARVRIERDNPFVSSREGCCRGGCHGDETIGQRSCAEKVLERGPVFAMHPVMPYGHAISPPLAPTMVSYGSDLSHYGVRQSAPSFSASLG
ncbi:hypothetical protein V6N11_021157 [Hibiscus sabdariffa]|uniref:Uncharacterized protein n=1 Tax=Hibiscus sabdariffa TaxID=183260 RepID=A0ABR2AH41_9ROSI